MASVATETIGTHSSALDIDTQEFLTFALGSEEYGIPILTVQEIIGYQRPTPLPNSPAWVSGVVNIRGVVIPVVDVRSQFGMMEKEYDELSVIIVTQVAGRVIGSVVDQVNDVLSFTLDQMQETPEVSDQVNIKFITGLGKLDDRLVMFVDMEEILNHTQPHIPSHDQLQKMGTAGAKALAGKAKAKKGATSKKKTDAASEESAETASEVTADAAPEATAEATAEATPETTAEAAPEATTETTSKASDTKKSRKDAKSK